MAGATYLRLANATERDTNVHVYGTAKGRRLSPSAIKGDRQTVTVTHRMSSEESTLRTHTHYLQC